MKKSFRESTWDWLRNRAPFGLRRWFKRRSWFNPIARTLFGNTVYSQSYYDSVEALERTSVLVIGDWIAANLAPKRVVDIGCGPGHMMAAITKHGIDVFGVDISDAAIRKVTEKGLTARQMDLTGPEPVPGGPYDLAICCEVAEHLEARFAEGLIAKLTAVAPIVFLTAAEPDPHFGPGLYHFNEQPNEYWIDLVAKAGFALDRPLTDAARSTFTDSKVISYLAKPMIFRKA